jgi:hypothetical protein
VPFVSFVGPQKPPKSDQKRSETIPRERVPSPSQRYGGEQGWSDVVRPNAITPSRV